MPKTKRPADTTSDAITRQAAAWLLRLRNAPDDSDLENEFETWLAQDPRHAEAWESARQVWSLAGEVGPAVRKPAADRTPHRQGRRPEAQPHRRRERHAARAWGYGAAMAASIVLAIVLVPLLLLRLEADYQSAVGETRDIALADGTRVRLDSGSAIAVDYTADRRRVNLLAGRAYFSVRQDAARPFSVNAEAVDATVTGTEFEVSLAPDDVTFAVAEGSVRVTYERAGTDASDADAANLTAGDGLRVTIPGGAMARMPVNSRAVASWRRGRLLIERATLGDLIEELRRYRSGAILITDDALSARQVTGVFDTTDPIRALKTVVEPHAGQVWEITPWLVVVSGG
ncbi:MAG: FecR family protein [Pseudomonadota bacterium]